MSPIVFNIKKSYLNSIKELGYDYTVHNDGIVVELPNLKYNPNYGITNPREQFSDRYSIDYDYIDSVEIT